jgi:hypothetical protein
MAKVEETVAAALRLLRVIDARQPVKPADMSTAIKALNGMMTRWEANTLSLGWSNVSNPSDDMPVPDEAIEPIEFNLALRLRPQYGTTLDPDTIEFARKGLADLQRDQKRATPLERARGFSDYNIETDSYI